MNTKDSLRKEISLKRKSLSKKERLDSEKSLVQLWESVGDSYKTNKVALYWPVNGEISTNSLISNFLKDGSECFLPIISQDKKNKILEFALFEIDNPLTNNRFDIPEPRKSTIVDLNELDVIFLPCVCFDSKGNRIGMGGGFYDKTLSLLSNNQKTQLILLAYDFQEVESCFPEGHDVKSDACLTPNQHLNFKD
jgi:5-formyltetrahydrofolate cyclo-ligase